MKEFEKWLEEYYKDKDETFWMPYPSALKIGWKTALEWTLKQKTKVYIDDDCNPPIEIVYVDIIEEELGEI